MLDEDKNGSSAFFISSCNSSYLENTARIKKFNAAASGYKFDKMVVVTEWEEFGEKVI